MISSGQNRLLARWKMDEGSGTTARDHSGSGLDATFTGSPAWTNGVALGGIAFDGSSDHLVTPAVNQATGALTITGWLKREGTQNANAGIVFARGGSTTSGFNFGDNNELRYHWDGGKWGWNSGLVPPDGVWSFVALVVEPDQATIYLDAGSGLVSAVNPGSHAEEAFDTAIRLGSDPNSQSRRFRGVLDDFRIYARALSFGEIAALDQPCPDTFASWAYDLGLDSPDANPDGDAFPSLLEYALDLDPFANDSASHRIQMTAGGSYTLDVPDAGVCDYVQFIEISPDLENWTEIATRVALDDWEAAIGSDLSFTPFSPGRQLLEINPNSSEKTLFFRFGLRDLEGIDPP